MRRLAAVVAVLAVSGCGAGAKRPPVPAPTPARPQRDRAPRVRLGPHPLRGAAARHASVPVLMYHVVQRPPPDTAYPELWVPGPRFAQQMVALRRAGYRGVTLERVLAAWRGRAALPQRPVVVSFDDGYGSQYRSAFPVLRRFGWPGVLNLELNDLGPDGLRPGHVREMLRAGWEVDSHTITHPDLTAIGAAQLRRELVDSRRALRRRFGPRVARLLCYPSGRFDASVEAAADAAGYEAATTTQPGWIRPGDDRFALPRVRVNGTDTAATVLAAVRDARP